MKLVPGKLRRVVRRVIGGNGHPPAVQAATSSSPQRAPTLLTERTPPEIDIAMIVGAQRSGTTWLQLLCAAHPKIAGGEELHLFGRYIGHLVAAYYRDQREFANKGRGGGLPSLLTTPEFDNAIKCFTTTVFSHLLRGKPGAELAIEKTPDHVLHLYYIHLLYPDVKIIHVIRDPRDVVVSQLAAAASWGDGWAAKTVEEAAQRWVEWVTKGRDYGKTARRYLEVRYESLLGDGPRALSRVYDFLGYPLPAAQVAEIYDGFSMAKVKANTAPRVLVKSRNGQPASVAPPMPPPAPDAAPADAADAPGTANGINAPPGFFRKGKAGGWRESLSEEDVATVERIAGPLMNELGYALAASLPADDDAAADAAAPAAAAAQ